MVFLLRGYNIAFIIVMFQIVVALHDFFNWLTCSPTLKFLHIFLLSRIQCKPTCTIIMNETSR